MDTRLLLWAAAGLRGPGGLSSEAETLLSSPQNEPIFSAASIWEIAIKAGLGRQDFKADPNVLRRALLDNGYGEMPIAGAHAACCRPASASPQGPVRPHPGAQASVEGVLLLTSETLVADDPGAIRRV